MTTVSIVPMDGAHADAVLAIYQAGIDEGNATFETTAPSWRHFHTSKLPEHRFVALDDTGTVLGWVAAISVSDRCVYTGVVEHSVYVSPTARGRGVGRELLQALIDSTEAAGIWTIHAGIFPENIASAALHRAAGFRDIGRRERIGQHHAPGATSSSSNGAALPSPRRSVGPAEPPSRVRSQLRKRMTWVAVASDQPADVGSLNSTMCNAPSAPNSGTSRWSSPARFRRSATST